MATRELLLVDWHGSDGRPLWAALQVDGCRVNLAHDEGEALALLRGGRPDLVLVDVSAAPAGADGLIRQVRAEASCPVVLLYPRGRPPTAAEARETDVLLRKPVKAADLLALVRHFAAPAGPPARLRVLVVEDHCDNAETLRMLLEVLGHEVRLAATGPEGVAAASAWRPEVVLCDIGLPGLDGYGVARALRGLPELAGVRLVAVTGYGDEETRARCLKAGFDMHFTKPIDPDDLLELLAAGQPAPAVPSAEGATPRPGS